MKDIAMKTGLVSGLAFATIFNIACSPVEFSAMKLETPLASSVEPSVPFVNPPGVTPEPPVAAKGPVMSKGVCASDSSTKLLSCMNCVVPQLPPPMPQFSKKGEALFEIMTAACQVPNGSDPQGYKSPTRADLLRRMNRLSPVLYPDSAMNDIQVSTISSLLNDPAAVKKMFGGIYYSGVNPTTTAFETYFGIETIEARYTFCYAGGTNGSDEGSSGTFNRYNSTPLQSKKYIDCVYTADPTYCRETPEYITANTYRRELRNGMNESINNPYKPTAPGVQSTCAWEKFEGKTGDAANEQVRTWLQGGFTIGGDIPARRMCAQIKAALPGMEETAITMAAYRCK